MVAVEGEPIDHQLGMGVDQLIVGHPEGIVDAGYPIEMVCISSGYHTFDIHLAG